jgi:hypothetical protein
VNIHQQRKKNQDIIYKLNNKNKNFSVQAEQYVSKRMKCFNNGKLAKYLFHVFDDAMCSDDYMLLMKI